MQRRSSTGDSPQQGFKENKRRRDYITEALNAVANGAQALGPGEHAQAFTQGQAAPMNPNAALSAVKQATVAGPHTGVSLTGDNDLDWLIDHESGNPSTPTIEYSTTAKNPKSSASGLGQLIKGNREAYGRQLGIDPNTLDFGEQLKMMELYIKNRYGTPKRAREVWEQQGWY